MLKARKVRFRPVDTHEFRSGRTADYYFMTTMRRRIHGHVRFIMSFRHGPRHIAIVHDLADPFDAVSPILFSYSGGKGGTLVALNYVTINQLSADSTVYSG